MSCRFADTIPVVLMIAVTEGKSGKDVIKVWGENFSLTFNYFVLSTGVAGLVLTAESYIGVSASALLPMMFEVYYCYRRYWPSGRPVPAPSPAPHVANARA